jgi:eukaryotic-like serine/threonine-protein kinase
MQIGPYLLSGSIAGQTGSYRFHATDTEGRNWEVRLLSHVKQNPTAWKALGRHLRFLNLVHNLTLLRPHQVELDNDPPYLVLEPTRPVEPNSLAEVLDFAAAISGLLAVIHRNGWSLGLNPSFTPLRTADGRFVLDLTSTDRTHTEGVRETEPADDIALLGQLVQGWLARFESVPLDPLRQSAIERMTTANPQERPTAEEVASLFHITTTPKEIDATVQSDVQAELQAGEKEFDLPRPLMSGDRLGRFILKDLLGEGGMGTVFRAEDPVDGTVVAVKVLRSAVAESPVAKRRFVKEVRLAAAMNTPFVTRVIDANTDGGRCFLALEYVPGESLGRALRRGDKFTETEALGLIADAARGIAVAHMLGIVHRDIKPDNLLLTTDPTGPKVKVTDFGLARHVQQSGSLEITSAGSTVGTPLYMPPEQFGTAAIDARGDVYSLGATLFHLLTGRVPFPGDNLAAVARVVTSLPAPAVDRLNPELSSATAALVARCLAKNPDDRPADADKLVRELTRLLAGETAELASHPLAPPDGQTPQVYVFNWEIAAPPNRVWTYVSNTEKLNQAAGLPAVKYELRKHPDGRVRRFGSATVVGFRMEWEEHPFEWIEGRRLGVLREYTRGPFAWFLSTVELLPNGADGTILRQTLKAQPRGFFSRLLAKVEIGWNAHRKLDRVYRRIEIAAKSAAPQLESADPFDWSARSPNLRTQLQNRANELRAAGANATAAGKLAGYLETASAQDVARIRPFALAKICDVEDVVMADACLRAVGAGMLILGWDVICPLCRLASVRRTTLRQLQDHEECQACDTTYQTDFAQSVELVFQIHPDLRTAEVGQYCAGGPAHSPHVVSQTRLKPGERVELELSLSPGRYRLRGPQFAWTLDLNVEKNAVVRRWDLDLGDAVRVPVPPLAAGGQILVLWNNLDCDTIVRVERVATREEILTAARASALPAFRQLFPHELLSPGQLATASAVTLVYVGLDSPEEWLEAVGEAEGFQHIQDAVRRIEDRVTASGGTVIKTVNEAVVAAFDRAADAVMVAHELVETILPDDSQPHTRWKASVHRGFARVATVNNRLDYFGRTAKLAAKLYEFAAPDTVLMSDGVTTTTDVSSWLLGRRVKLIEVPFGKTGRVMAAIAEPVAAKQ